VYADLLSGKKKKRFQNEVTKLSLKRSLNSLIVEKEVRRSRESAISNPIRVVIAGLFIPRRIRTSVVKAFHTSPKLQMIYKTIEYM